MGSLPDICEESFNERLLQKGYFYYCGALIKKRNVSIIRIFPPDCGRNAPYIHMLTHSVKEEMVENPKTENFIACNSGKASEIAKSSIFKVVNAAVMESEGALENKTLPKIGKTGFLPQWYTDIADILKENSSVIIYSKKRISMIREYPPFCGRNAPCLTDEELKLSQGNKTFKKREKVKPRDRDNPLQGTGQQGVRGVNYDFYKKRKLVGLETSPQLETKTLKKSLLKGLAGGITKKNLYSRRSHPCNNQGARVIKFKRTAEKKSKNCSQVDILEEFQVIVPSFGSNSSGKVVARNEVRDTLRLLHAICRKLLQGEETKIRLTGRTSNRIDILSSNIIKDLGKEVNKGKPCIGPVPGVDVGDEYQYRVELALVGLHRSYQSGIDYTEYQGYKIATSIVSSGGYADDLDFGDVLKYTGQGGNVITQKDKTKQPEDQKLVRGNLALKNSISAKTPVRVIRGYKEAKITNSGKPKIFTSYTYDGLYNVERYWQEVGSHGKLVYMFELKRCVGQPELALKEVKRRGKLKVGHCEDDISRGKEKSPISAINTIDDEKPPKFNYITKMKYPDSCCPVPPKGCDCVGQCWDSQSCSCVLKNGDFPYNFDGAIVEVKPLVYECGSHCKCPLSCYNKVSQHGIKIHVEIFKTKSRGWGVRSISSIPSGTFICEYLGDLLNDKEAETKKGKDEYLFDIGQNYSDCSADKTSSDDELENDGFAIDAMESGNVGRFINHSCSPNLYAQNVLYDYDDKRMPHIMLFAADNIPPLQELTYHYNYAVDQITDLTGNIKIKNCYCGSEACTGRMY